MRQTNIQRDSRPASHELFKDPLQKAELEARNGLLQFDEVLRLVDEAKNGFTLRVSTLQRLLVLGAKLGYRIPGTRTIPEQIVANRQPYYEALDAADAAWLENRVDISVMEKLLTDMLAVQLASALSAASNPPRQ